MSVPNQKKFGINFEEEMLRKKSEEKKETRSILKLSQYMNKKDSILNDSSLDIKNEAENALILLRKSKTDQDSTGKWLHLSHRAHQALVEWMEHLPKGQEKLIVGIDRGGRISRSSLGSGQINRIYKRIAKDAGLNAMVVKRISGHSMRVGAAQDLLNSGASMPIIMQRGRWSKTDTVMRYVEHV